MDKNQDSVSIIIPFYNEEDNILPLIDEVQQAMDAFEMPWELVLVDDGSVDDTLERMEEAREKYGKHVHVVELMRNFGQTAAMQAGIDFGRGSILVTLDGDLQNDPADIPAMVRELKEKKLDMLAGWRKNRKDTLILRKIPSKIANRLIRKVTGVYLQDYGCSLKVYRSWVIKQVRLYGEMHRFIPAWVAVAVPPKRIGEKVVNHRERHSGESKYGISRTIRVIIDLLFVWFFMKYRARPGHFFGSIGLTLGAIGMAVLVYLGFDKFILGNDIGGRPMLLVGIVMVISSIQFLTTGILGEMLARTYFESTGRSNYYIRNDDDGDDRTWK